MHKTELELLGRFVILKMDIRIVYWVMDNVPQLIGNGTNYIFTEIFIQKKATKVGEKFKRVRFMWH